jgi:hypothetical protein
MRQSFSWLIGFAFLLLTLPAAAQTVPPPVLPALEAGASCPADADLPLLSGAPGLSLPEEIGLPSPIATACEPNFCTLERDRCQTLCSPCSFDFSCRGRTCESICTCRC